MKRIAKFAKYLKQYPNWVALPSRIEHIDYDFLGKVLIVTSMVTAPVIYGALIEELKLPLSIPAYFIGQFLIVSFAARLLQINDQLCLTQKINFIYDLIKRLKL